MLKGYKGKITELPGPNFKPRPVHHHCEDPNEFCGLIKLSRIKTGSMPALRTCHVKDDFKVCGYDRRPGVVETPCLTMETFE